MIKRKIISLLRELFPSLMYKRSSYSQDGEDMLLKFFYGDFHYKGFYVDVGAHHPYRFSNTAHFYKRGWSGINIEPTPTMFNSFVRYRKRDINLNIAISNTNDPLTFYQFDEAALNSFDEASSIEIDKTTAYKIVKKTVIRPLKLAEVLEKYMPKGQKIDFLTIDVEGLDLEVLKSNDWNKFVPDFILVECNRGESEGQEKDAIYTFLREKSYKLVGNTPRTSIFQKQK
ncbi:FkbM family methyltransferase [Candidatus Symbiothrix dinenymphae]|nr:FkbM family methyltransferase [Candidatus Symbiothrix dinenymphae]